MSKAPTTDEPPTDGAALLKKWIFSREMRQRAAAKKLRLGEAVLSHYLARTRTPIERVRAKIEKRTDGAVPASSWVDKKARA